MIEQLFPRNPDNDAEREARVAEVESIFPIPGAGMFIGAGLETGIAVNETRLAYMHGLWLSTIFMAVAAIGRHIAGFLSDTGKPDGSGASFPELARQAEAGGHISSYERAKFIELYEMKANYARFRGPSSMIERLEEAGEMGLGFNEILQDDARMALALAAEYFSRCRR